MLHVDTRVPLAVPRGFARSRVPGLLMLELEPQDFRNVNACTPGWITTLRAADALHQRNTWPRPCVAAGPGSGSMRWMAPRAPPASD